VFSFELARSHSHSRSVLVPRTDKSCNQIAAEFWLSAKNNLSLREGIFSHFISLNKKLKNWEEFYNFNRPHGAFEGKSPYEKLNSILKSI